MVNSQSIWVFYGANGRFASGVFTSRDAAEQWIRKYKLTGVLTKYPLDEGVFDWAIKVGHFNVKKESQNLASFIQNFTSASQDHIRFQNGESENYPIVF